MRIIIFDGIKPNNNPSKTGKTRFSMGYNQKLSHRKLEKRDFRWGITEQQPIGNWKNAILDGF